MGGKPRPARGGCFPLTTYAEEKILNALMQGSSLGSPANWYIGLLTAPTWAASTAYSQGQYVVPSNFNNLSGQSGRIFQCSTAGTSASSEPSWPSGAGATVSDGSVVWTETTIDWMLSKFGSAEQSGGGYARVQVGATSSMWSAASAAVPSQTQNLNSITFPSPSANWGQVVAFLIADAASGGSVWWWGTLSSSVSPTSGSAPSWGANNLTLGLD